MSRLLLTGPAGSGKTQRVVSELAALVAAGPVERFVVLVPTYSRAEHLKRRLLRSSLDGMFARPGMACGTCDRSLLRLLPAIPFATC